MVDDELSEHPKTATTDDNIAQVRQIVLDDRRIKVKEIAEAMNISEECVYHILHENLGMRKLSARWVPRSLTSDQKRVRINIYNALWRRLITVGETWIHHYTTETETQSKQSTAKV